MSSLKQVVIGIALSGMLLSCKQDNAQSKNDFVNQDLGVIQQELDSLLDLKSAQAKDEFFKRLQQLEAGSEENALIALDYYLKAGKSAKADSIQAAVVRKFPEGVESRFISYQKIFDGQTPEQKKEIYDSWLKQFPPEHFKSEEREIYNTALSYIIQDFLSAGQLNEAHKLTDEFLDTPSASTTYFAVAGLFYRHEHYDEARAYLQRAMDSYKRWKADTATSPAVKATAKAAYNDALKLYAMTRSREGNCAEALSFFEDYKKQIDFLDEEANLEYADCLEALGQQDLAYTQLEEIIKKNDEHFESNYPRFKRLFIETQGDENALKDYERELNKSFAQRLEAELVSQMISEQAPAYSLTDLEGNTRTAADLRGKIVVLDFWATWCAPCKASFPAMQQVKNHFKEDENVVFLFVDTMENLETERLKLHIKKYLSSKNYDFDVFLDLPDGAVAEAFKVKEIPYKFILDPEGNIRYKIMGYEGNLEAEQNKLIAMIDVVKKGKS